MEDFCAAEHPRLVGALGLYTGDAALAEELAQEALLRAVRNWPRVAEMAAPGAWVHRVGLNLAKSHFRRLAAGRRARVRAGHDVEARSDPDAAEAVAVRAALQRLSPRRRAAIVLRYYLQWPDADTAAALGVAEASVRSLVHRGLADLRRALDESAPRAAVAVIPEEQPRG